MNFISCPEIHQLRLSTRPFIWKVASSVYVSYRKPIFIVFNWIQHQTCKFNLAYRYTSLISCKIVILLAHNVSLLCKTFSIVALGTHSRKLRHDSLNAFNILFWRRRPPRWFALFHSSAYLRVVKLASNRFVFRTHGSNYATLYPPTHPRHHTVRCPPSAAVESVLRMHMEYAQKDECVRNWESLMSSWTRYNKDHFLSLS